MAILKDEMFEDLEKKRFKRKFDLDEILLSKKDNEIKEFSAESEKIKIQFDSN